MCELPTLKDIQEARERLEGVAHRTPILTCKTINELAGANVSFKAENLQRGGVFKIRGAYNRISRLSPEQLEAGVTTYSSGNHALAVALAASLAGTKAKVVMPKTAPEIKVKAAKGYGAQVEFAGTTSEHRLKRAQELVEDEGLVMIPPFDDFHIIAGQGTVGMEIAEQAQGQGIDAVLVPVGGGGLLSGIAIAIKAIQPDVHVYGVEPEGASAMLLSLESGKIEALGSINTVADGLCPLSPGKLTFSATRQYVDGILTVTDWDILEAMKLLLFRAKTLVEPSGAAGLAGLMASAGEFSGKRVTVVLSGGNVDPSKLAHILSE